MGRHLAHPFPPQLRDVEDAGVFIWSRSRSSQLPLMRAGGVAQGAEGQRGIVWAMHIPRGWSCREQTYEDD